MAMTVGKTEQFEIHEDIILLIFASLGFESVFQLKIFQSCPGKWPSYKAVHIFIE
jgi:hypothetical protein